jgi:hypothetical protein
MGGGSSKEARVEDSVNSNSVVTNQSVILEGKVDVEDEILYVIIFIALLKLFETLYLLWRQRQKALKKKYTNGSGVP